MPTVKVINPYPGMTMYDPVSEKIWMFNGATWHPLNDRLCLVCNYFESDHEKYSLEYSDGHKFVGDNLEYLEYKYERSIK